MVCRSSPCGSLAARWLARRRRLAANSRGDVLSRLVMATAPEDVRMDEDNDEDGAAAQQVGLVWCTRRWDRNVLNVTFLRRKGVRPTEARARGRNCALGGHGCSWLAVL